MCYNRILALIELEKYIATEEILDNATNVAELLSENDLNSIGHKVVAGYDDDRASRAEWEDRNEAAMELALQVTEEKSDPWPGAANVKYPLLTTAALQFSSRAYPALISSSNIVKGRVVGFDTTGEKMQRAIRIGKHMSYQLIEQMEDWEEEMDKLCLTLPILGCIFKKTYYCPTKGVNVSEVIYPKDLVINYFSPTIEKSQRITHVLQMTENDIYERKASGLYLEEVELTKEDIEVSEEDHNRGLDTPQQHDSTLPYNVLEQHCLIDLDGDGYKEPYIVTVHEDTAQVLRIIPRYTVESIVGGDDGSIIRINPIQYFTKFGFIPSPDGSIYDLGFGTLLGPMNDTINTLINQLLDAGTMSNLQSGFISKGIRISGGNHRFEPNEWKSVNTTGDDLRKGIFPLPTREPSNVLYTLLNTMVSSGERLSSVTEMMTGEIPGQNTKATVAMAAIEQGMKVFSAIYKRIYRSLKKEFRKLYELNKEHIGLDEYFTILDVGQERAAQISRIDYTLDDTDVIPYADPTVATEQQRLARIEALGQLLQLGTINPQEYTRRYIEATEQPAPELLMKMPPPKPESKMVLEQAKFKDESNRKWQELRLKEAELKLKEMELTGKVEIGMVDSIVKITEAKQKGAKIAGELANAARSNRLEKASNNQ